MSRLLKSGANQITNNYENHVKKVKSGQGWAIGTDIVKRPSQCDYILAHSSGTVLKVVNYLSGTNFQLDKEGMGYGNYVMILHDNNIVTLYSHLSAVSNLTVGAKIAKGTIVGFMGNTGNSYGAHLHFEVRRYSSAPTSATLHNNTKFEFLNPELYLEAELPKTSSTPDDIKNNTIPNRFKVLNKDGKQIASYTNYIYAENFAKENNGVVMDSSTNKQLYPDETKVEVKETKPELTETSYPNLIKGAYRVRKSYSDEKSSIGSWSVWANAYRNWSKVKDQGYHIYDTTGKQLD